MFSAALSHGQRVADFVLHELGKRYEVVFGTTPPKKRRRKITKFDMPKRKVSSASIVPSSGNVFADLGLPEPEEKQTKVRLAVAINQIIETMGLSQLPQLSLSISTSRRFRLYRLNGFSVERLIHFLNALGRDVEIVIRKPRSGRTGKVQVTAA
jgi:predicted XRE-type DNA-binding protein